MFKRVVWSPCEVDYLKKNRHFPVTQLSGYLAKSHAAVKKKLAELDGKVFPSSLKKGMQSKIGKRKDLNNQFFRSAWEANFFRLLKTDNNIHTVQYEPTTFSFTEFGILKGTVSYTPDFKINYKDGSYHWVEVKGGFMRPADKTKLRRFKKYFPEEFKRLVAVTPGLGSKTAKFFQEMGIEIKHCYPDLNKKYKNVIPNWE